MIDDPSDPLVSHNGWIMPMSESVALTDAQTRRAGAREAACLFQSEACAVAFAAMMPKRGWIVDGPTEAERPGLGWVVKFRLPAEANTAAGPA